MKKAGAIAVLAAFLLCACSRGGRTLHLFPGDDLGAAVSEAVLSGASTNILLHGGEYRLEEPVCIRAFHGKGLSIKAFPGENPIIRGDVRIALKQDPKDTRILHAELSEAGTADFGLSAGERNRFDLYCNGIRQIPARWPDDHYANAGKVLGKSASISPTPIISADPEVSHDGLFEASAPKLREWAAETSGAIHAFPHYNWLDSTHDILAVDASGGRIQADSTGAIYGFMSGFRYFAYNLLCELDRPGEYHLDTRTGHLTWFRCEGYDTADEVSFPVFSHNAMLEISDSENVEIEGITFRGARNGALIILDSSHIALRSCHIDGIGGDAMLIRGCHNICVEKCIIERCGHSGILAYGGDRVSLEGAEYLFKGNLIRDFSQLLYTYHPGLRFIGCGAEIVGNEFYGAPSSAMRVEANDVLIEGNYLHDLVTESDDQGALDIFGNYYLRGIRILGNRWENIVGRKDSSYGGAAVRLDDMICGVEISGNTFRNCGGKKFGAIQIHGGKDNVVENNDFISCPTAISFAPWAEERWKNITAIKHHVSYIPDSVKTGNSLYLQRYPALREDINACINRNFIRDNRIIDCGRAFYRDFGNNIIENNIIKPLSL